MKTAAVAILLALAAGLPAAAADKIFAVQAPLGTYLLVVGEDGQVQLTPLQVVRPNTDGGPVDPLPPPVPPELAAFRAKIAAIPLTVPATERAGIAKLYRTTATLGLTSLSQIQQATSVLFAATVRASDQAAAWESWKGSVDSAVDAESFNPAQATKAWGVIADVLEAGA